MTEIIEPDASVVLSEGPSLPMTPMQIVSDAIRQGASVEVMEKLMAMQERWEANEAKKAFIDALSAFKANPPEVFKNKHVNFDTKTGGKTSYRHATLDNVCDALGPALSKHGLSWRWKTDNLDQGIIRVTCVLTHALGHSETTALQATADASGGKNHVQAIGSTVTYLQRYTLLAAAGIAVQGQDDDGAQGATDKPIGPEMVTQLQEALAETGADIQAFCKFMRVNALAEITESGFGRAISAIDAKRKKGNAS